MRIGCVAGRAGGCSVVGVEGAIEGAILRKICLECGIEYSFIKSGDKNSVGKVVVDEGRLEETRGRVVAN